MLDNNHEAFSPPTSNCTLWRYMDLSKLLSMLENRKLFFSRADKFDDPYEGALTKPAIQVFKTLASTNQIPPQSLSQIFELNKKQRRQMYISCWFISEHESAAMWKLYLQSPEGVAIRSDHDSLASAIDGSSFKGRTTVVKYVDYETTNIPTGNLFFPFVHKRLSFKHENELRAIFWSQADVNKSQIDENQTSVQIDIQPEDLIKAIHVSPTAPSWFGELVNQLIHRYSLSIPVVHSSLYDRPIY